jgi:hypothetical protein
LIVSLLLIPLNFRINYSPGGTLYKFPDPQEHLATELMFRQKPANAFQARTYNTDLAFSLSLGQGVKMNFKRPSPLSGSVLPEVLVWDDTITFEQSIDHGDDDVMEDVLPPDLWGHNSFVCPS